MRKRISFRMGTEEKPSLGNRQRQRLSQRMVFYIAGSLVITVTIALIVYFQFFHSERGYAATAGDYRSAATGTWNSTDTWQRFDGTSWVATAVTPTSADGVIEILSGHTVTINANVTADQVLVDAGGQLTVSAGTLTVNDGTGTDVTVNGTLDVTSTMAFNANTSLALAGTQYMRSTGTITMATGSKININSNGNFQREGGTIPTSAGYFVVNSGGTFKHAMDGGSLPSATWNTGSTLEITGVTVTVPSNLTQTYQNFKWNSPNQTASLNFAAAVQTVSGNFICANTGTGGIQFDSQGNSSVVNVGGNFIMQNGILYVCTNGSSTVDIAGNMTMTGGYFAYTQAGGVAYGNISTQVTVRGNITVSGGQMDMSQYTGNNSNKGTGIMNLYGNINVTAPGLVTETQNSRGQIIFTGGGVVQTYALNGRITNTVDYIINPGAVVRTSTNYFSGSGDFTLMAGGALIVESPEGITKSAMAGSVQVTGTRSYNTGADYTFQATSAQVTGDGLPTQVRNLTLNNASNVTLTASTSVSGVMTLTSGLWLATTDTLTLGTSTANLGTLTRTSGWVVGNFRRWVAAAATSNVLFPLGSTSYYNGANFSFTTAPSSGSIVSSFVLANPGTGGLPVTDGGDVCNYVAYGYWTFGAMNGFSGGVYDVSLYGNGFANITDYTKLHILRRTNGSSNWAANGNHSAGTGSNSAPVANRGGMSSLGSFGVISGSANPLPIELVSFNAKMEGKVVRAAWKTASETNNNYFTLERSADGTDFISIAKVDGAGNSTTMNTYSTVDPDPLKGFAYYRLKQTDYDGKFSYSKSVTVRNSNSEEKIVIDETYPTPFSDRFSVNYTLNADDAELTFKLMTTNGSIVAERRIPSKKGANLFTFDGAGKLQSGHYIMSFSNDMFTATRAIMK